MTDWEEVIANCTPPVKKQPQQLHSKFRKLQRPHPRAAPTYQADRLVHVPRNPELEAFCKRIASFQKISWVEMYHELLPVTIKAEAKEGLLDD
jgi:hypothetical protein